MEFDDTIFLFHGGVYTVSPRLVRVDFVSNINPIGISSNVLNVLRKIYQSYHQFIQMMKTQF